MMGTDRNWLAGVLGFALALACCLPFVKWGQESERAEPAPVVPSVPVEDFEIEVLPTEPGKWLGFARQAGALPGAGRETALGRLLELPEKERREALTMLLLRWSESDPSGAVLWCQNNLEGVEHRAVLKDLATTWAHRDAMGIAQWWAEHMPDSEVFSGGTSGITGVLARTDPIAYATYMDIPRLHKIRSGGVIEENAIPRGDRLPAFARQIVGNVGYHTDKPDTLKDQTLDRHLPGKSGWNQLFEIVARHWHKESPEACEAWLDGFPEEAQIAARFRIKRGW